MFVNVKKIFRQKNTIFLENYNRTPLDMYNGLSQVLLHETRRKNSLVYKGLIAQSTNFSQVISSPSKRKREKKEGI